MVPCYYPGNVPSALTLARCLDQRGVRTVIVANSFEASGLLLAEELGAGVEVLHPGSNLGFGGAVNLVLDECASGGDGWMWVVNDDVSVAQQDVETMLRATSDVQSDVALVAGAAPNAQAMSPPGLVRGALRVAGLAPLERRLGRLFDRIDLKPTPDVRVAPEGAQIPFWFVALRQEPLLNIGGFDARAPLYFEDVILQGRLRAGGWRLAVVAVGAEHIGSASGNRAAAFALPAAAAGYLAWMSETRRSPKVARLTLLLTCAVGLPAVLLRRGRLRRDLAIGLLKVMAWAVRPRPVTLPWRATS